MAKLSRTEADQIMEKFSKLTLSYWEYAGRGAEQLVWKSDNHAMSLTMSLYDDWRLSTWDFNPEIGCVNSRNSLVNYDWKGSLHFSSFTWWQRVRLKNYFRKIKSDFMKEVNKCRQEWQEEKDAAVLKTMVGKICE